LITESITPAPQLFGPRSNPIRIILIHATRGLTASSAIDYSATKNWFRSSNNNAGGTWGGCASSIIGPNGELCHVLNDDQIPHYSAGYGGLGPPTEYLLDDYAKSYELAQPNDDVPYTAAQYERLAIEAAIDCKKYNIPATMLDLRSQRYPVPTGIGRHDRSANGVKLGKSDPGKMFDEERFIALLNKKLQPQIEEEDMGAYDKAILDSIATLKDGENVADGYAIYYVERKGDVPVLKRWDDSKASMISNVRAVPLGVAMLLFHGEQIA
jgi:hypothetical protein